MIVLDKDNVCRMGSVIVIMDTHFRIAQKVRVMGDVMVMEFVIWIQRYVFVMRAMKEKIVSKKYVERIVEEKVGADLMDYVIANKGILDHHVNIKHVRIIVMERGFVIMENVVAMMDSMDCIVKKLIHKQMPFNVLKIVSINVLNNVIIKVLNALMCVKIVA